MMKRFARMKLRQNFGNRLQVARVNRHDGGVPGRFMQGCSGRVTLGNDDRIGGMQVANDEVSAFLCAALEKVLIAAIRALLRKNRLHGRQ